MDKDGDVAEGRGLRGWLLAGRKEEGTSLAEEALRWSEWACEPPSLSRNRWEWSGLEGSEAPPPLFSCSKVSSTTSGVCVCFGVLCLSSLLNSFKVVSMSCNEGIRHKVNTHRQKAEMFQMFKLEAEMKAVPVRGDPPGL